MQRTLTLKLQSTQTPSRAIILTAALLILLSIPAGALSQTATEDKAIVVSSSGGPLHVGFRATKPVYAVNEAINFTVQGNHAFYLYLFSVNKRQNRAVLLTPANIENAARFKARRKYMLPGGGIEFFADRPGLEKVLMVATTLPISLDGAGLRKSGSFLSTTADGADNTVKRICTRTSQRQGHYVVKKLTLIIQ